MSDAPPTTPTPPPAPKFERDKHLRFLQGCLRLLPHTYASQDPNRLTLLYFVVSGLDVLNSLDLIKDKASVIDWIYSLQVLPDKENPQKYEANCGFRGSTFFGLPFDPSGAPRQAFEHDQAHIAMTYTALCLLVMLGDDLSRVHKKGICAGLRHLQKADGSFASTASGTESDMRFVYCACTVSTILNDWSGMDVEKVTDYIRKSAAFDFAFGQGPSQEAHGGSTYCAVASLALMGRLDAIGFANRSKADSAGYGSVPSYGDTDSRALGLVEWLLQRQVTGFQGRINKDQDSCYSWWLGSTLHLLGFYDMVDLVQWKSFLMSCQAQIGGYGKYPDTHPDVLHTYFSLCGMSFLGQEGLSKLHCALGLTIRSARRLTHLEIPSGLE